MGAVMAPAISSMWRRVYADTMDLNRQRRARVLAYPDLASRLTQHPLGYTRPENWNGYVPPRTLPDSRSYGSARPERVRLNDSPFRAALVEICAEAMRRQSGHHE